MAFVSRSARRSDESVTRHTAAENVGPGSYRIERFLERQNASRLNFVPFGCASSRDGYGGYTSNSFTPAPGAYLPSISTVKKESSKWSIFRSAAKRFQPNVEAAQTPGPGAHIALRSWTDRPTPRRQPQARRRRAPPTSKVFVPSIPVPSQSFGYTFNGTGELQKRKPKTTPKPELTETASIKSTPRATDFGRGADRKSIFVPTNAGPGPGHYDPFRDSNKQPTKPSAVFAFKGPKGSEPLKPSDEPGPGHFEIVRDKQVVVPRRFQNFGSRASRGLLQASSPDSEPGSGSFELQHEPNYIRVKPLVDVSFGQKTPRFAQEASEGPGPQDYNVDTSLNRHKYCRSIEQKRPFGSSTKRFLNKKSNEVPGPASYDVVDATKHVRSVVISRPSPPRKSRLRSSSPAPGSYTLPSTIGLSGGRNAKPSSSFASGSNRFDDKEVLRADEPGPAHYNVQPDVSPQTKATKTAPFSCSSPRFPRHKRRAPDAPGPADYNVKQQWIHKTYNVSIDPDFDTIQ